MSSTSWSTLLAREGGRPRAEVATLELLPAIDALIWIADDSARVLGGAPVGIHRSMFPAKRARVAFEPFGVVAVIGAGSAPFAQPLGQIAAALVAGNAVVFKPARRASLAGVRIARLLARAGLPEGLVRLVHGGAARARRWPGRRSTRCCSPARRRPGGGWRGRACPRTAR